MFSELISKSSTGKSMTWSVRVFERDGQGIIETTHGYVDGKKQMNEKVISEGKNIGKKNATTPLQQATNEAQSAWTKKRESGYSPVDGLNSLNGIQESKESKSKGIDEEVPSPMLAHDYLKRGKSISFPCFVQRKFDGTRCLSVPGKGLFSRNRKKYPHLNHIVDELNSLPFILDGELYSDTLTFQEIVGIVKRETLKKGDAEKQLQIKFYVYDIVNSMPYDERYTNLQLVFKKKFKYIEFVKTDVCESEEKMKELHAQYVAEGYEGIMLRNKQGLYKNDRSVDLQKYKEFQDGEYEVVDFKEGEGLETGCVVWVCKLDGDKVFHCRPRGTREERAELYKNGKKYVGKKLTVRFQELTDDKVPRFPVGIAFRDYE